MAKIPILSPSSFRHYVDAFNLRDKDGNSEGLSIPNSRAWEFFEKNVPLFDCPDKQLEETYYFRWWAFRKHLRQIKSGWVVTEFLPQVPWAGVENTISCAAGHHLYEARWLRDPAYAEDYAKFWFTNPQAQPRNYSFWAADAVNAVYQTSGNAGFVRDLLPSLVANYHGWEKSNFDPSVGLFHQIDDRDGMEYSLGGSGYRPSINSYLYGDAMAITMIATSLGDTATAVEFLKKAADLKRSVQDKLWNPTDHFFETVHEGGGLSGVREQIGFIPWYFYLAGPEHGSAWKSLLDPKGFAAPYGPTTAERRATGFMQPENHDCLWNGPSWPYATTQTLVALANLLDAYAYDQKFVTKRDYFRLLKNYSDSQRKDGGPWIAEDLDPDTGKWIVDLPRSVDYNHSGFADLIISGLVGLRPQARNQAVIQPLVPPGEWPWFCLDGVRFHDHLLTILWDQDGKHYGQGKGFKLYSDGVEIASRADLGDLEANLSSRKFETSVNEVIWKKYPVPVLGGKLGTCFDISVLRDQGKYKMYFSWRPHKSIAMATSTDGIRWDDPQIVLGPAGTGWEDEVNRPVVVKHGGGYSMWYTGQFDGRSSIGYATSPDGLHWKRSPKPVLEPRQSWEKVAVMCPTVLWDDRKHEYRMWYSGGDQYEPDAIGYATSKDGVKWDRHDGPIFQADPQNQWENFKVTACQVTPLDGWFYMFYIGFRDIDHAQIGLARSRDGISGWERLPSNPIVSPTDNDWDADACYKPFAIYDKAANEWMLWYNGRHGGVEQIGLVMKKGKELGF